MAGKKSKYNFNNPDYDLWNLSHSNKYSMEEKKEILQDFRRLGQSRLSRLAKSGIADQTVKNWSPEFHFNINDLSESDINMKIMLTSSFLRTKGSTVSGVKSSRKKAISTLQEKGYKINSENYDSFIDFIRTFGDDFESSTQALNFFSKASGQGYQSDLINEAFELYTKGQTGIKKLILNALKKGAEFAENDIDEIMKYSARKASKEQRKALKAAKNTRKGKAKRHSFKRRKK